MPDTPRSPEYAPDETLRKVPETKARIVFKGQKFPLPKAFRGEYVAIRPRGPDGDYGIFFGALKIASFTTEKPLTHPDQL